jgi:hypothetical protein
MTAKQELLDYISRNGSKILCAIIKSTDCHDEDVVMDEDRRMSDCKMPAGFIAKLPMGYAKSEYNDFLESLDFELPTGTPRYQHICGTVWMDDGSWFQRDWEDEDYRGSHDDFEYWNEHKAPNIPDELTNDFDEVVLLEW